MSSHIVAVFNAGAFADRLAERTRGLEVQLRHADFPVAWDEIAARRGGRLDNLSRATDAARAALQGADALFAFAPPADTLDIAPGLQWVETPATGFDQLNGTGLLDRAGVAVTTVGGGFAPWVAEHAFALLLGVWRKLDRFASAQQRREWGRGVEVRALAGATLGVVGLGNIGQAVARAGAAFGMRVVGTRRRIDDVPAGVARVYAPNDLRAMLGECDAVVLAVAGTPETTRMIGAAELAAMRPTATLINVARGIVVDEAALTDALREQRIAAAGLDVFDQEPLPAEHPLWALPNVLITPHIAVNVPEKLRVCVDHFAGNLGRWCRGEALADRVAD